MAHNRTDIVTVHLDTPFSGAVLDSDGNEVPVLVEHDGATVSWLARDVPSLGWRSYRFVSGAAGGWKSLAGDEIANDRYRLRVDAARGGAVCSLVDDGRELIADGGVGNELAVYEEYSAHPQAGEGPWHLLPTGPVVCSSAGPADDVQCYQ
ncbi:glycoside hydrolase, partial [Streptomyces sp. DSM 41529]|nr:glycoside hydrolase [Streptomyces sp. DSM 41529]